MDQIDFPWYVTVIQDMLADMSALYSMGGTGKALSSRLDQNDERSVQRLDTDG